MLQNSQDSINHFLQNKSFRNNSSHSIKYTNQSNNKKSIFNNSFFNKKRKMIPSEINLTQENRLLTSANSSLNNNYKNNSNRIENSINRSYEHFPRIIFAIKSMKIMNNNSSEYEKEKNNSIEKNLIKKSKSSYYKIQINEEKKYKNDRNYSSRSSKKRIIQESASLPLISDNIVDKFKKAEKEKSKFFRRDINTDIKIDQSKYMVNRNEKDKINKIYNNSNYYINAQLNCNSSEKRKFINFKSSYNFTKEKESSLDNKRIYNHYSLTDIYDKRNFYNNKNNLNYIKTTNKKEPKEKNFENTPINNIISKNNNLNLYEDFSNLKTITHATPKNTIVNTKENNLTENKKIISIKNHHILYESKNLKNVKQADNPKQKVMNVKIINSVKEEEVKRAINFKNYKDMNYLKHENKSNTNNIKESNDKVINLENLNNIKNDEIDENEIKKKKKNIKISPNYSLENNYHGNKLKNLSCKIADIKIEEKIISKNLSKNINENDF